MNIWEESDGYQDLYLFNGDTQIWKQTIEHGAGYKETTPSEYTFVIELNIADYRTVDWMQLTLGHMAHLGIHGSLAILKCQFILQIRIKIIFVFCVVTR